MPNPVTLIATKSPTTRRRSKKIEKKLATILSSAPPSHEPPSQLVGIWQNLTKRWFILLWCLAPIFDVSWLRLWLRNCLLQFFWQKKQFFCKNGPNTSSFSFILSFQTRITIFTANICEKMSLQLMVLGFELMSFGTWVSSHYH